MGYLHHVTPRHTCRTPEIDGEDGHGSFWQCDDCEMTWVLVVGGIDRNRQFLEWRELRCRVVRERHYGKPDTWDADHFDRFWLQRLWDVTDG